MPIFELALISRECHSLLLSRRARPGSFGAAWLFRRGLALSARPGSFGAAWLFRRGPALSARPGSFGAAWLDQVGCRAMPRLELALIFERPPLAPARRAGPFGVWKRTDASSERRSSSSNGSAVGRLPKGRIDVAELSRIHGVSWQTSPPIAASSLVVVARGTMRLSLINE
jgi:hypothetical protein